MIAASFSSTAEGVSRETAGADAFAAAENSGRSSISALGEARSRSPFSSASRTSRALVMTALGSPAS